MPETPVVAVSTRFGRSRRQAWSGLSSGAIGLAFATSTAMAAAAAPPPDATCTAAVTQAEMNRCVHEDFLAASALYAERYRLLSERLAAAQRERLRRMQSAWLKYRTEACRFEAGPAAGGSVHELVYWRCAARMTRERSVEFDALGQCREGDLACSGRRP
jgi:uncharacterized protein YecT (DUF1311 family)